MIAPDLLVKEKEKNVEWCESWIKYLSMIDSNTYSVKMQDIYAWNYYNNRINPSDTNYLTKIGDAEFPSKVRRIPKQRPYLNRLAGQLYRRPWVYSCVLADKTSIKEKYIDNIKDYIDAITEQTEMFHYELSFGIQQIKDKIQQLQQTLQQEPETPEEAEQLAEIRQIMPRIMQNFQYASDMLQKRDVITKDQITKLEEYHKFTKKDWKEMVAQKTVQKLKNELYIMDKSLEAFISGMVTGRKAFMVEYKPGYRLPVFESIDVIQLSYPKIENIKWIQEGPWVKKTEYISYPQLIVQYGKQFEKKYGLDKLKALKDSYPSGQSNMIQGRDGEALFTDNNVYTGTEDNAYSYKVERCWWRVPRNIKVKYTPNPFEEGIYFRHFIQNKEIIDIADWKYSNGFYINKNNPKDIRNEDEVEVMNSKKGESTTDKYTYDLYYGIIINNEYILDEGQVPLVLRDIDRHGLIYLPVFGKSHSSITDQPYSLIWSTKNVQDLYDIVHYHKELMLALSGTKTILYDLVWKPGSLTTEEWEYEKKKGIINIESVKEDGRKNMSGFNQFQMFDLSVSSSIGILDQLCINLDETMGNIMGLPRQMKGQVVGTDQVGTYNAALKQGALINEVMYAEHDEILARAITHLLNLTLTYCYKDGEIFGLNNTDLSGEIVNIPENILNNVRFKVIGANNTLEGQNIEDLKQMVVRAWEGQQIKLTDVVQLWDLQTVAELKHRTEIFARRGEEIQMMMSQNAQVAEQEKIKLQIQLQNELLAPWKEQEQKLKEFQIQVTKQLGELNVQILAEKNVIEQKKLEADTQIKHTQMALEKESEDNVVALNDKHSTMNERIRMLELEVNTLLEKARLTQTDKAKTLDHHHSMAKVSAEKEKTRKMSKEHVGYRSTERLS